jgi:uncharacterized surface protein with fasciclin (FAS1) repeats
MKNIAFVEVDTPDSLAPGACMKKLMIASAAILLMLAGCATAPASKTIAETADRTLELSTLTRLLKDAELIETLQGTGPFTVFAPSDAAFKAVPAATMEALAKDKVRLKAVLSYHVVPGALAAADVKNGPLKTVQGGNVSLYKSGSFLTVEEALVTGPDVRASNGVIHLIDKVLIPPTR